MPKAKQQQKPKRVSMDDLTERRGTWTLAPEALQRMSNAVVATVIRLAADSNDSIEIKVGHVSLGAVYATTRYDYDEINEMISEATTP